MNNKHYIGTNGQQIVVLEVFNDLLFGRYYDTTLMCWVPGSWAKNSLIEVSEFDDYVKMVDYADGLILYYKKPVYYSNSKIKDNKSGSRIFAAEFIINTNTNQLIKSRSSLEDLIDVYVESKLNRLSN